MPSRPSKRQRSDVRYSRTRNRQYRSNLRKNVKSPQRYGFDDDDGFVSWTDCNEDDSTVGECEIFAVFPPKFRNDAEQDCNDRGGHLAWIENQNQNDIVLSLCENYTSEIGCHIGLKVPFSHWSNGDSVSYTNWYIPHFDNGIVGQEETWIYTSRRGHSDGIGYWDDFGGGNISYICSISKSNYITCI